MALLLRSRIVELHGKWTNISSSLLHKSFRWKSLTKPQKLLHQALTCGTCLLTQGGILTSLLLPMGIIYHPMPPSGGIGKFGHRRWWIRTNCHYFQERPSKRSSKCPATTLLWIQSRSFQVIKEAQNQTLDEGSRKRFQAAYENIEEIFYSSNNVAEPVEHVILVTRPSGGVEIECMKLTSFLDTTYLNPSLQLLHNPILCLQVPFSLSLYRIKRVT